MLGKAMNLCGTNLVLLRRNVSTTSSVWQQKGTPEEDKRLNIMRRYLRYMNYYEQILEKRFPAAMKVYRIFKHGINNFYQDVKTFAKVKFEVEATGKEQAFSTLTRKEIEVFHQLPKDMMKIAPVLLVSALPMANFVVYPLAYMYPKQLLTSHFWTEQQKADFNASRLNERLKYTTPLFKCLQTHAKEIMHKNLIPKWSEILQILQNGKQPTVEQLIECKHLFVTGPYSIHKLHFVHRNNLLRLHGVPVLFSTPSKLKQRAYFLKETDSAIIREGGVLKMKDEDLKLACFIRGFDASQLSHEAIIELLEKWITISSVVEKESYSLLLHCSLLLSYNLQKHITKSS